MKKYFLGILFLFFSANSFAQDKDLEREILQYSESKSDIISKGRRLLTDKFLEGDLVKVKEVKDYLLTEVEDDYYTALYPAEEWMIRYWTGEYAQLASSIVTLNEDKLARYSRRITPPRDMLYVKLVERSWDNLEMLEDKIMDSDLETGQKDFLLLHLNYMVSGEPLLKLEQEDVNKMADLYLQTNPNSPYEHYVRNNIRYHYVPSDWAVGMDLFGGYGILTEELSEQYTNPVFLGLGFDVEYQKLTMFLRGYVGIGSLKKDREYSTGIWEKGESANISKLELALGYTLAETEKIKLSPFLGMGLAEITAPQPDVDKNPGLDDAKVKMFPAYTLGLNLNFKLGWDTGSYYMYQMPKDKSYWFFRVRYGYTLPQFNEVGHNGNFHHITIGLGGIHRGMKREI